MTKRRRLEMADFTDIVYRSWSPERTSKRGGEMIESAVADASLWASRRHVRLGGIATIREMDLAITVASVRKFRTTRQILFHVDSLRAWVQRRRKAKVKKGAKK